MRYNVSYKPKVKVKRRYRPAVLRSTVRKEREFRFKKFFVIACALAVVSFAGWWGYKGITHFLFDTGYFEIKKIEIRGLKNITDTEVRSLLPFRIGDNMVKMWTPVVESGLLEAKPELRYVNVSRQWHKIVVTLEERVPVARVLMDGRMFGVDENNVVFSLRGKWAGASGSVLPEIASTNPLERKRVLNFITMLSKDYSKLYSQIVKFGTEPANNITVILKDGVKVYWGQPQKDRISEKAQKLDEVLQDAKKRFSVIEYISLYYFDDGRILVKPVTAAK